MSSDFAAFIHSDCFPCMGTKSALALGLQAMFEGGRMIYTNEHPYHGCQSDLGHALAKYGVKSDHAPIAFKVVRNADIDGERGEIAFTAFSAGQSNNFTSKPIHFGVE